MPYFMDHLVNEYEKHRTSILFGAGDVIMGGLDHCGCKCLFIGDVSNHPGELDTICKDVEGTDLSEFNNNYTLLAFGSGGKESINAINQLISELEKIKKEC